MRNEIVGVVVMFFVCLFVCYVVGEGERGCWNRRGMCSVQFCVFVRLERGREVVGVGKVCVQFNFVCLNVALQDRSLLDQKKDHWGLLLSFDEYWSFIYK
jgi:hypothetical protein